jgi:hypothetical protein
MVKELAVSVEGLASEEDLEVARQVSDNEAEQDDACNSHNRLLADRSLIEPEGAVQVAVNCD